jgi:hypothetical protein
MQLLRFNSDYYSVLLSTTTLLLLITLRFLCITSHPLLHITSLGVSNTTNYLRNVILSNGFITTCYVPGQLADVMGSKLCYHISESMISVTWDIIGL